MMRSRKSFALGNQTSNQWENDAIQASAFRSLLQQCCSKNDLIISSEKSRENGIEFFVKHSDNDKYADARIYNTIKNQYKNLTIKRLPDELDSLFFTYKKKGPEIKKSEAYMEVIKVPILFTIVCVLCYIVYVIM
jgi:phage I-like protein